MTQTDLKSKLEREPFRPFIIELGSGRQITISQDSEVLFPRKRPELVIAFTSNGLMHEFELGAIQAFIEL
jgi:hypothetical protein